MTATYTQGTDIAKIRLYCSDTDISSPVFQDEELQDFYALEGDIRLAAAAALERMASSQTLMAKVRAVGDISLDGISLAKQLLNNAERLREVVEYQGSSSAFDVAELYYEDVV